MSKKNDCIELKISIKRVVRAPEVTKFQYDITNLLIQATPDGTKVLDALTAGCLYVATVVDQCLPDRPLFKDAFYAISTLVAGLINGEYKEKEGGGE